MKQLITFLSSLLICINVFTQEEYSRDGWGQAFVQRGIQLGITLSEFNEIPKRPLVAESRPF